MTIPIHRLSALHSLLVAGLMNSSLAFAHGGEDHGAEGKSPAPTTAVVPRAAAQSDDFELVAVLNAGQLQGARLTMTLDRFKTNEPVVGAKLEVDAGGQNLPVHEASPGIYVAQLAAPSSLAAGASLPLTITVDAGDTSDLLTTTLEVPAAAGEDPANAHSRSEWTIWMLSAAVAVAVAVAVAAAGAGLFIIRRRRQTPGAL